MFRSTRGVASICPNLSSGASYENLTHDGQHWLAMLTGAVPCPEGYTIGALSLAKSTNREAFGRLRGIPPERFDRATADQLREALVAALSGDDE
jgi:hypothetical protein